MNQARTDILNRVRANRAEAIELPSMDQDWQTFADPLAHFRKVLAAIGGASHLLRNRAAASTWLNEHSDYSTSQNRVTMVDGVGHSSFNLGQVTAPHELSSLDWAVMPGEFAVAENGSIWITDRGARHRAVYFLCEHLVLVLGQDQLVHNMHQAYQRLAGVGEESGPGFGAFVAGPSKTADIEQSLVIGAQGPRSLDVLLLKK